jgi:hypothetical protein
MHQLKKITAIEDQRPFASLCMLNMFHQINTEDLRPSASLCMQSMFPKSSPRNLPKTKITKHNMTNLIE